MGEMKNAHKVFVGKRKRKISIGRLRRNTVGRCGLDSSG
jgi:hypothetical protein